MVVYLRARDVRSWVKELGPEMGMMKCLEQICEENAGHRQMLQELGEMVSQCIDQVSNMIQVGTVVKDRLEEVKRINEQYSAISSDVPTGDT